METKIGLRNKDYTPMHLPLYYSKRWLYDRFCFVSGWEVKPLSDSLYPLVAEFKKRDNDNEDISDEQISLWPEGTESLPVCSWHTYLRIWRHYLPNLRICPSLLDTCDLCNEYAKYIGSLCFSQMETFPSFVSNDPQICPDR